MRKFSRFGVLACLLMVSGQALAEDTVAPPAAPVAPMADPAAPVADDAMVRDWQATVSGQIEAFRTHDAPAALSFAAAPFHLSFKDPAEFFVVIMGSGYAPIIQSRSHSFGPYKMLAPDQVIQDVRFTGTDQSLYEALYQLTKEPGGWRVSGVRLKKAQGVGV